MNDRDYRHALKEIEGLMAARRNTRQGEQLDVLTTLVEAGEVKPRAKNWTNPEPPNPNR